jgi:hypothetical protein
MKKRSASCKWKASPFGKPAFSLTTNEEKEVEHAQTAGLMSYACLRASLLLVRDFLVWRSECASTALDRAMATICAD